MSSKKERSGNIGILDAVEVLSNIAEMEVDRDLIATNQPEPLPTNEGTIARRSVDWLHQDIDTTITMIKEVFRCVHKYLRTHYKREFRYLPDQKTTEGIKAIMVLVGEAGKKLDRYASFVHHNKEHSITKLKEYKRLQEFYLSHVAKKVVDEHQLGRWILGLSRRIFPEQTPVVPPKILPLSQVQHLFVDFDSVKKDHEYELFFIRKEDGSRFFSPRLVRNIKLVCDFGGSLSEMKSDNPLDSIDVWQDRSIQLSCMQVVKAIDPLLKRFYHENILQKGGELPSGLGKILIALKLASSPENLLHDYSVKKCSDYFHDFQHYLRDLLHSREYQRLIVYPPEKSDVANQLMLDLVHAICKALFLQPKGCEEFFPHIKNLLQEAEQEMKQEERTDASTLSSQLQSDFTKLSRLLKKHTSGPLAKLLEALEDGSYQSFDPYMQGNHASQLYELNLTKEPTIVIGMPAPIHQEFINKSEIIQEFKGVLRGITAGKHLLFNLQDRTSWREHARALALEELQEQPEFSNQLVVVTLPKDTEFYHQLPPYNSDNHAEPFLHQFKQQLKDDQYGFYFPPEIKKELFPTFVDETLAHIHKTYFENKNVLTLENRLNFIEIFYLMLQLKLIEMLKPTSVSFTCKDGVDIGAAAAAQFLAFSLLQKKKKLSSKDVEAIETTLFAPSIQVRQRMMDPERFARMLKVIRQLE